MPNVQRAKFSLLFWKRTKFGYFIPIEQEATKIRAIDQTRLFHLSLKHRKVDPGATQGLS